MDTAGSGRDTSYNPETVASVSPAQHKPNPSEPLSGRHWWLEWRFVLFLGLLLAPCFWQSRIQAGDLSSHLYNSWLALQIRGGTIHSLFIARQSSNVAFDWLLTWFLAAFGVGFAQRIAVSLCVLIFVGGAFAFIASASGRCPWFLTPCIAVLAYGFVLHIGFFNFYLSLGISLWFLAAFWNGTTRRRVAAAPLLLLAWLGHPLPVVWALGAAAYLVIARQLSPRRQLYLLGASIAAVLIIPQFLFARFHAVWTPFQVFGATGADQAFVYGPKYLAVMAGLLLLWLVWLRRILKGNGFRAGLAIPAQVLLLTAAGVALIPSRIDFPEYGHALVYVADRMSLAAGVMLCVVLARVRVRRPEIFALVGVAALFFSFLYADSYRVNRKEDQIEALVQQRIPRGARVVFLSRKSNVRFDPLLHVMDRVCLGYCFSYANYEPSTGLFRVRATENNGIVVSSYKDSYQLGTGDYVVRPQDLPLYQVEACHPGAQQYCVRELPAGQSNGHKSSGN